jgi:beta-galactosidase
MATGYPRNDDGHPTRFYLFKHHTPQALVGDDAHENRDPDIFLTRQAFMTKELAETIRRTNRSNCAGVLPFAYLTWFRDVWSEEKIKPFATYYALRKALQPVWVSAELYGRHFYAGQEICTWICIVNDSEDGAALPSCKLVWELHNGTEAFAKGEVPVPDVPYYSNSWIDVSIQVPAGLPTPRVDGSLRIWLEDNGVLSSNDHHVTLTTRAWAEGGLSGGIGVAMLDPRGEASAGLRSLNLKSVSSIAQLSAGEQLVVAGAAKVLAERNVAEAVDTFVKRGGRVLLLNPGVKLSECYPSLVTHYRAYEGQIASMQVPESKVFSGIESLDLSWVDRCTGNIPIACSGVYQVNRQPEITCLASTVDIHGYLRTPEDVVRVGGSSLVELRAGSGMILASEMFLEADSRDPIAERLLSNLIHSLRDGGIPSKV